MTVASAPAVWATSRSRSPSTVMRSLSLATAWLILPSVDARVATMLASSLRFAARSRSRSPSTVMRSFSATVTLFRLASVAVS